MSNLLSKLIELNNPDAFVIIPAIDKINSGNKNSTLAGYKQKTIENAKGWLSNLDKPCEKCDPTLQDKSLSELKSKRIREILNSLGNQITYFHY